ncbi:class I SAM-dependent methyltransferase [Microaceticoccus formicicus]|uniref:class I SAM-dependent methyltransferase n=1 Tax=Microaceticoccus formicicus TaxID=3118105 RepID=UPI003CD0496C|nr:class I SAM-dependent methyltransferase [Peptoniphilaceae bacterium AMB_02]
MKKYIKKLWKDIEYDSESVKTMWNNRAESFSKKADDEEHYADIKGLVNRLDNPNEASVLDIGSADGRHSIEFAKHTNNVLGIDIADNMVKIAVENALNSGIENIEFRNLSWEDADIKKLDWKNKFDLVFANFSPAIHSSKAVLNMTKASKQLCYISQHVQRINTLRDDILVEFGDYKKSTMMRDKIIAAFNTLWEKGYLPELTYDRRITKAELLPEDFESFIKSLDLKEPEKALEYLKGISKNEKLEYEIIHLNAIMIWDVRNK